MTEKQQLTRRTTQEFHDVSLHDSVMVQTASRCTTWQSLAKRFGLWVIFMITFTAEELCAKKGNDVMKVYPLQLHKSLC